MKNIVFQFEPHQHVRITAYGLNYSARVIRCLHTGGIQNIYGCDFASDGKIEYREFFEDEVSAL